jgi:two-component system, cell cycle sensor histidine kinase and response regulator CckA
MIIPKRYSYYTRIGLIFLLSAGFLALSAYVRNFAEHSIFTVLFPAVALSAWVGGRLGGLISTLILTMGAAFYFLPPEGSMGVDDPADAIRLGVFSFSGAFVAWLSGALKENQGIITATLRSIGDAVIATDRRGRIRFLNPAAEALTGWSQNDAKGRHLEDVFRTVHPETGEVVSVPMPGSMRGSADLPDGTSLISKTGDRLPIDDSLAPIQIDTGRTIGSILVFRDATRRKQNEASALESERHRLRAQRLEAVGRLAGGVAHDFNNLLTVINGYAELMMQQIDREAPERGAAEAIHKAGERAAGLTRQLLVFSRGRPPKLEIADLNQIVANFEKMLRRLIAEDVDLVTKLTSQPLPVLADIGQIEQVIMNLAVNARDAMPKGGRLTLETRMHTMTCPSDSERLGQYAELAVTDTGIGMDSDTLARVFEPFFTTKDVHQGTGLGLSVAHGIVKGHHGEIRVKSEPGKGSVFSVYLPLTEVLPEVLAAPSHPDPTPAKATILLVEDNPEVRHLMRDILSGAGHVVLEAIDVEDALSIGEDHSQPIHLLISDIVMPGCSGTELAKRLTPTRPGMCVLFVSGYPGQEVVEALEGSQVAFLQKPFDSGQLAHNVAELLARSRHAGSG